MSHFKIDVHHHILPQTVVERIKNDPTITRGLRLPEWSPTISLEFMDRNAIDVAILSLPIPTTVLSTNNCEASLLCREINQEMARVRDRNPTRFGFFATLPAPGDSQACILEIQYALDDLGADGVVLFSSYGERYLGHPGFEAVWAALAARATVVLVHPTIEGAEKAILEPSLLPRPMVDWTHETTRTAIHLVTTGMLRRNTGCKVILSHGGGTLPYVAGRAADLSVQMGVWNRPAGEFLDECRTFYFDVALAGYWGPLQLLSHFAQPGHVLYGTDFPFAREAVVAQQLNVGDETLSKDRAKAEMALFPRIRPAR